MARSRARQPISVPANLPPLALPALPDLKAVEDAFANIFKSLQGQQAVVLNIKALLSDKTTLQERVALTREQENAQKELNKALFDMARADPRGLRESVRLTLEQQNAQKELSKATDQERNRQRFGSLIGGTRNLLGIGVGGREKGQDPLADLTDSAKNAALGLASLRAVALGLAGHLPALPACSGRYDGRRGAGVDARPGDRHRGNPPLRRLPSRAILAEHGRFPRGPFSDQ
jgi:hypothetical protein